ncbi:deoxyribonuclease IV [Candidatus Thorarchaeota archaeon]|nr:MAG: deoxyribonuclease IV [Candidatus Thorarchaeota archaeon]
MEIHNGEVILLSRIRIGTAGYPSGSKGQLEKVFDILTEADLSALEYAAVHGLRTSKKRASKIGELAKKHDISMSIHGAYYISLASKSDKTRRSSKDRLVKALEFAPRMAVSRIVFHPGTYGGLPPREAHIVIKEALQEVWDIAGNGSETLLAPEIAGKINSYGSVDEIVQLCSELEGTVPTIDWAHLHARRVGNFGTKQQYLDVLTRFEDELGDLFVNNMHFHVSGIKFTDKGEAAHRPLGDKWGPDILPLMEIVDEVGYSPVIISESPDPLHGALYAKFLLEELQGAKS